MCMNDSVRPVAASCSHRFCFCCPSLLLQVAAGAILGHLASKHGELRLGSIQQCESLSELLNAAMLPGCLELSISGHLDGPLQRELTLEGCAQLRAV